MQKNKPFVVEIKKSRRVALREPVTVQSTGSNESGVRRSVGKLRLP